MNGSGYPEGIPGEALFWKPEYWGSPMSSKRCLPTALDRPALGVEIALQEIKRQNGVLYDRKVVEACLKLLQDDEFTFEKLMSAADQPEAVTAR